MNRLRSRKKSQSGETSRDGSRRPSLDIDVPAMPSFASRTFRRKKSTAPEPKPELDISAALPSSDDFRTSLLMPNLSARFSMLRDQDDPNSKIGKANDDSVLFPKRASRLDLFNSRLGLSNIAEVDSLRGSIRPPFAYARTESFGTDGYATDDGSVMSRSRPGEGNTMFGGRQKIYKIPVGGAGSVKNFGAAEDSEVSSGVNMGGKALYESDIAQSTFQRLREQEREERERAAFESSNLRPSREQDRSGSPPLAKHNRHRDTSSSTNSAPSQPRTSTAATSVASQKSIYGAHENNSASSNALSTQPSSASSDRPFNKTRRLYGQGLDQHMFEQQSSALNRLDSLHRARSPATGASARTPQQSRSVTNLNDRYQRGGPLYTSNGFRAGSPPPSATPPRMADFDLGLDDNPALSHNDSGYGRSPPLSPPISPDLDPNGADTTLLSALEPNDIGKATASGAFNKPKKQYDERQYLQRQLQLQEDRNTPSPQLIRPFSPHDPSIDENTTGLSRTNSFSGSMLSRTGSIIGRHPWMEDRVPRAVTEKELLPIDNGSDENNQPGMDHSFFNGMSSPDVGSAPESESEPDPVSPVLPQTRFQGFTFAQPLKQVEVKEQLNLNPGSDRLAEPLEDTASDSRSYKSEATITQPQDASAPDFNHANNMDSDSPTLGPVGVPSRLSGLVRAHLRNDSGQSSIYPEDSPSRNRVPARESIFGHQSALNQHYEELEQDSHSRQRDHDSNPMPPPLSLAARSILEQATALRDQESNRERPVGSNSKLQRVLGDEAPRKSQEESAASWQERLRGQHTRGASTETQKEREDLANELAERRRLVQGKLQTFVEAESRSASRSGSPAPGAQTLDNSSAKPGHPFALLKKSSKGSLVGKQEKPSKAMKMLGIDRNSANVGPNRLPPDLFMGRERLSDRAMPPSLRKAKQSSRPEVPANQRHPEDVTQSPSQRSSKSSSAYSNNSQGGRVLLNGSSSISSSERGRATGFMPKYHSRGSDEEPTGVPRLPPAERSQSAMSGRARSNSRPTPPASFERTAPPGTPFMINPAKFPATNPHPALRENPMALTQPTMMNPRHSPPRQSPTHNVNRFMASRKQSINKHDISEPTFISSTSSVDTLDLPPGASLSNGMDSPPIPGAVPPIPVRDSRRKRTQTLLQALGRGDKGEASPPMPSPATSFDQPDEEKSTFSADEDDASPRSPWSRLRKTSSEGNNMNSKTRGQGVHSPSSIQPNTFSPVTSPLVSPGAEHVPYQAQHDVPASAVMF